MHTFGQSPHTPGLDCVRTKLKAPDIFSNVNLFMRVYFLLSGLHYCSGYCLVFNIVYRSHFPFVISGRMALLVTLFLVLVNIFNSVTGRLPRLRVWRLWKRGWSCASSTSSASSSSTPSFSKSSRTRSDASWLSEGPWHNSNFTPPLEQVYQETISSLYLTF